MNYYIWDNDNAVMVCATESRKEAFTAILNHLIEANGIEIPNPIMWPVAKLPTPNEQMPDIRERVSDDAWSVITQAQDAYNKIVCLIPMG